MRPLLLGLLIALFPAMASGAVAVSPNSISNLVFWLDSTYGVTTSGITVTGATDRAVPPTTVAVTGPVTITTDVSCRGRAVFDFSGVTYTSSGITSSSIGTFGTGDHTWMWYSYPSTATGNADVTFGFNRAGTICQSFALGDTTTWGWGTCDYLSWTAFGNAGTNIYQVHTVMISGGKIYRWTNNTIKTNGVAVGFNFANPTGVFVAYWSGRQFKGRLSEALVYQKALTDAERESLVEYLTNGLEYTPPSLLSPYLKRILSPALIPPRL